MSVDAFSGLPFQAGHAVAAGVGRTAKWAIGAYVQAPLRNTAIAALTTLSAMAGSNALYHQAGHHPAPLFGNFGAATAVEPVMPVERPVKLMVAPVPETTGSVSKSVEPVTSRPIGNEDVFDIQRKLTAFKFFDGKVDGLFGPRTSRSIRAFETSIGRQPTGQLTPEIIALIKATPITADPALKLELPAIAAFPAPAEITPETPAALALEDNSALPAPAPLVVGSVDPAPEATASLAVETTDEGEGVSTLEMTSPAENATPAAEATISPTKRAVQTIAIKAPALDLAPVTDLGTTAPIDATKAASDPTIVGSIQRGLASLGFLHGAIDGVAGEATAKAIRNFEVYYNYNVTGRITPGLVNLLVQNGAVI